MIILDLLVALSFGLVIVWMVSRAFGTRGPWGSLLWFYLVVSIFAWAGGVWLVPFGPRWAGIGWFPIIFMGFLASLMLTAASPRKPRKRDGTNEGAMAEPERRTAVDVFFWALIICLLIFGFSRYTWFSRAG